MSINCGLGKVFTYRKTDTINVGHGVYDPNKVFTAEDENGKIYVDDVRSKIVFDKSEEPGNTVKIGGRDYPYVQIGNWLVITENLDYKYDGLSIAPAGNPTTPAAWYYNNDEATYGVNGNKYGLLYNGYAAIYMYEHAAELFPAGWNLLPDNGWYQFLMSLPNGYSSGLELRSTEGWNSNSNGNNEYQFDGKPAGLRTSSSSTFVDVGDECRVWQGTGSTCLRMFSSKYGNIHDSIPTVFNSKMGASVRLFKFVG